MPVDQNLQLLLLAGFYVLSIQVAIVALLAQQDQARRPDGRRGKRKRLPVPDYSASVWAKLLSDQAAVLNQPSSRQHKQFRLRFRVPYSLFRHLVLWTEGWYYAENNKQGTGMGTRRVRPINCAGTARIPAELLVLGCLRMLGRGTCLDGIEELSLISPSTMNKFFHSWCERVTQDLYPEHVQFPTADEDIAKILGEFSYLGFPGCIGSMDVIHIPWHQCPAIHKVLYTGKEGFPTIAYQVIVSHSGRVLACTPGFYGSLNDKTIVKFDGQIRKLREGSHNHVRFELRGKDGKKFHRHGVWVMVDGGYLKWAVTMAASKTDCSPAYSAWRSKLESIRKDVECFFGRLTSRFRILRYAIQLHSKEQIDNVFFTCVTLQNMLHDWDGLDEWKNDLSFGDFDVEGDDTKFWGVPLFRGKPITELKESQYSALKYAANRVFFENEYYDCCGTEEPTALRRAAQTEAVKYHELEADLVAHFTYLRANGLQNTWLRSLNTPSNY